MEWLRLVGLCVLAAGMVMVLRQMHPPSAALLSIVFALMAAAAILPGIAQYVERIHAFFDSVLLDAQYGKVLFKAMGITLVTQLACEICREMDAPAIARRAELIGRMALMGIAVPVFLSLAEMAVGVLQ